MQMTTRTKVVAGVVSAGALLLIIGLAVRAAGGDGTPSGRTAAAAAATATTPVPKATSTPSRGAPAGPAPSAETAAPTAGVRTMAPVGVGASVALTSGVQVSVGAVTPVTVSAKGPGEISGPGVTVRVTVTNASSADFDLNSLAVNASYGKNVPAIPSQAAPAKSLTGSLKAGGTATGTYVFSLPKDQAGSVRVDVSSSGSAAVAVFHR